MMIRRLVIPSAAFASVAAGLCLFVPFAVTKATAAKAAVTTIWVAATTTTGGGEITIHSSSITAGGVGNSVPGIGVDRQQHGGSLRET